MSRVLQCRSLILEVISRSSRVIQERSFPASVNKCCGSCTVFARKENASYFPHRSETCSLISSNFHTSAYFHNQEPLHQDSTDKAEEQQSQSESAINTSELEKSHGENGHAGLAQSTDGASEVKRESVIDRLRRLSMTDADEYIPSVMAQEKAKEMARLRQETIKRGEQWKWDQRNLRPGGPPAQQYGRYNNRNNNNYGMRRNPYDEDDDYESEQRWSRRESFDNRRLEYNPRSTNTFDDGDEPENYEVEMQKLRERMEQIKARKAALANKSGEDLQNERRSYHQSSSSSYEHEELGAVKSNLIEGNNENISGQQEAVNNIEFSPDHVVDFALVGKDPDTFGSLSYSTSSLVKDSIGEDIRNELLRDEKSLSIIEEEEEEDDVHFIPPYGERWTTKKLVKKVRALLEEKKLKEAVDTYLNVLKEGGFKFDDEELRHHFNVLINECANVGYVEMAFRLWNLMKKRGYKHKCQTISSLLNACANSPWDKDKNLDRIEKLLINLKDNGQQLNFINYHALIKAYGRLGEMLRAFYTVDQMIEESKFQPVTETFNMLLQACISDKKDGFRYALITWRKMQSMKKVRPDIYSYNLLLRCVRDCGIELPGMNVGVVSDDSKIQQICTTDTDILLLPPIVTEEDSNRLLSFLIPHKPTTEEAQITLDNLGEPTVVNTKFLKRALCYPENRLAVLGGVRGVISQMVRDKVGPNLKTLTELLDLSRAVDINDVLQLVKTYKIKPDLHFFNKAIHLCYELNQHKRAEEIFKLMHVYNHVPNIDTWGALSFGCRSWLEAKTLLSEMDKTKFTPNTYVFGSLLASAIRNCDPKYILHLLEEVKRREITVTENFIRKLDDFISSTQSGLVAHEMGKAGQSKKLIRALERNPDLTEHFCLLKMRYNTWIQTVDVKIVPENPWKADFEYFRKNKKHKIYEAEDNQYVSLIDAPEKNQANTMS